MKFEVQHGKNGGHMVIATIAFMNVTPCIQTLWSNIKIFFFIIIILC
jgi:hypothetical protein